VYSGMNRIPDYDSALAMITPNHRIGPDDGNATMSELPMGEQVLLEESS
jgi:hypothetical protein